MPAGLQRIAAAFLLIAGILSAPARSAPIATFPILLDTSNPFTGGSSAINSYLTYSFWVAPANPNNGIGSGHLMLQFVVSAADLGTTFVASALNMGADFTSGAVQLTDAGLNDFVSLSVQVGPNGGGYGFGTTEVGVPIDLRGQTLGSIQLIVDEISFDIPGSNPNRDGLWTDTLFNGRLVFDSTFPVAPATTPEPATLGILAAGLGLLTASRRWRPYVRNGS